MYCTSTHLTHSLAIRAPNTCGPALCATPCRVYLHPWLQCTCTWLDSSWPHRDRAYLPRTWIFEHFSRTRTTFRSSIRRREFRRRCCERWRWSAPASRPRLGVRISSSWTRLKPWTCRFQPPHCRRPPPPARTAATGARAPAPPVAASRPPRAPPPALPATTATVTRRPTSRASWPPCRADTDALNWNLYTWRLFKHSPLSIHMRADSSRSLWIELWNLVPDAFNLFSLRPKYYRVL